MIGTLVSCGHDLNHLLDYYTMEQLEIMALSVFQHKLTQMRIISHAIAGSEASDRMPKGPLAPGQGASPKTPEQQMQAQEANLAKLGMLQSLVAQAQNVPTQPSKRASRAPAQDASAQAAIDALASVPDPRAKR